MSITFSKPTRISSRGFTWDNSRSRHTRPARRRRPSAQEAALIRRRIGPRFPPHCRSIGVRTGWRLLRVLTANRPQRRGRSPFTHRASQKGTVPDGSRIGCLFTRVILMPTAATGDGARQGRRNRQETRNRNVRAFVKSARHCVLGFGYCVLRFTPQSTAVETGYGELPGIPRNRRCLLLTVSKALFTLKHY
jgi:hypothetical protein